MDKGFRYGCQRLVPRLLNPRFAKMIQAELPLNDGRWYTIFQPKLCLEPGLKVECTRACVQTLLRVVSY
jgi:hypothetical protein